MKLPFTMEELDGGFSSATGFLSLEKESLRVEVKPKRFGFHLPAKDFRVALGEIDRIRVKKGWIRTKVILELNSLDALGRFPKHEQNEVHLVIKKDQRVTADEIAAQVTLAAVDRALDEM